jgi:hypothetical protein
LFELDFTVGCCLREFDSASSVDNGAGFPDSFTTENTEIFKEFLCGLRELCGEKMLAAIF